MGKISSYEDDLSSEMLRRDALKMEAESIFGTSVNFYQTTRRNMPEDRLHTRRRENLKSHLYNAIHGDIIMIRLAVTIPISVSTQRKTFYNL
jgi:hypothetical protein